MKVTKTLLAFMLSTGLLLSISACGKRGDPIRPSDVVITDETSET